MKMSRFRCAEIMRSALDLQIITESQLLEMQKQMTPCSSYISTAEALHQCDNAVAAILLARIQNMRQKTNFPSPEFVS